MDSSFSMDKARIHCQTRETVNFKAGKNNNFRLFPLDAEKEAQSERQLQVETLEIPLLRMVFNLPFFLLKLCEKFRF